MSYAPTMMDEQATEGIGPSDQAAMDPMVIAQVEKAEQAIATTCAKAYGIAQNAMKVHWQDCDIVRQAYLGSQSPKAGSDSATNDDFHIEINEIADQVDSSKALFKDFLKGVAPLYRLVAEGRESPDRVALMQELIQSEDRECNIDGEVDALSFRLPCYRFAGLKAAREKALRYVRRLVVGPDGGPVLDGQGVPMAELVEDDLDRWPARAIRPDCFAMEDPSQLPEIQPSVHEVHYWTKEQMQGQGFVNLDRIGAPNAGTEVSPLPNTGDTLITSDQPSPQRYRVIETWMPHDWAAVSEEARFLLALKHQFGPSPMEFMVPQRWCVLWVAGWPVRMYPNYLAEPQQHPYNWTSYSAADVGSVGQSLPNRIGDLASAYEAIFNLVVRNVRRMVYGSKAIVDGLGGSTPEEELEKLDTDMGVARIRGNSPLNEILDWYRPPDATSPAFQTLNMLLGKIQGYGVNAVLQGDADAKTLGQDQINNARGQSRVNSVATRLVEDVIVPNVIKRLKAMAVGMSRDRWIDILGEDGASLAQRMLRPADLTDRFRVIPVGSYAAVERRMMSQDLIGVAKIWGSMPPTPMMSELLRLYLQTRGYDKAEIDRITGSTGATTGIQQEITALLKSPDVPAPIVRPEDNHQAALAMLHDALLQPDSQAQNKAQWPNVRDYATAQLAFVQAEMAAAQAEAAQQQSKLRGPQATAPPSSEGGISASDVSSPPDSGAQSKAGMTGTGSIPHGTPLPNGSKAGA